MTQAMQKNNENQPVIAQYLERFSDQIAAALPRHMTPDRMARIVMTEVRKTPKLLQCNPKSLFGAVIQASQLGLEPGSALGHAYLVPYGKEVQLIMGYRGMIDLARRSGQIVSIEARTVYAGDEFSYSFGLNPDLQHTPCPALERGEMTHVYAIAKLVGGGLQWDVMENAEVLKIRDESKGYIAAKKYKSSSPWDTHPVPMALKTVVRRLFKFLPVSIEMQSAIGLDEQVDAGVHQRNDAVIDGDFTTIDDVGSDDPPPATKTGKLKEKLAKDAAGETGEITLDFVLGLVKKAKNKDALDEAADLARALDDHAQGLVNDAVGNRLASLKKEVA